MICNNWSIDQLKDQMRARKIICYGAGMVAHHVETVFSKYDLLKDVLFFVDRDKKKINTKICLAGNSYEVKSVSQLYDQKYRDAILMITCEDYQSVLHTLSKDVRVLIRDACAYPHINNGLIHSAITQDCIPLEKNEYKIPAKIHYCWFGGKDIPEEHRRYIEGWKKLCPEYEFYFWNENNYDVSQCRYTAEAYEKRYYAFVTDYVRMDVMYKQGGIYFDTDVELIRKIDSLRGYEAFFTYGKWPAVNSGSGFGAAAGNQLIREMRDIPRRTMPFLREDGECNKTTNCFYETETMKRWGFQMDFSTQIREGILLLSPRYFPPSNYLENNNIPDGAIALHRDAGSWKGNI